MISPNKLDANQNLAHIVWQNIVGDISSVLGYEGKSLIDMKNISLTIK